jgi:hypothetical protein
VATKKAETAESERRAHLKQLARSDPLVAAALASLPVRVEREKQQRLYRLTTALAEVARLQGGGGVLDELMPRSGDIGEQRAQFQSSLQQVITDPRRLARFIVEVQALPPSTELCPWDVRQELTRTARRAQTALGKLGVRARNVRYHVGIGYSGGKLGVFERPTCGEREILHIKAAKHQLPKGVHLFAVAFEVARNGLLWLDHCLVREATRALTDAQAMLAVATHRSEMTNRSRTGGRGGAGKPKRSHTELIRRAVQALVEKHLEVSAANVRLLLKSGWEKLALEWGDPLREIVEVQVRQEGPVIIEYTAKWAVAHRGKRLVELDADALDKAIARAPKNK